MNIQTIKNVSDCVPLYLPHSLYLKPFAKFNISVGLPQTVTGKTISNWDVMEKIRKIILPDQFSVLKVSKSTLEFIRFDAEIDEHPKLKNILNRLDGAPIKLSGFNETVKIKASIAKDSFPSRHDWDSFFRDARDMDEMKAGERPDTVHITNLPIRWFCPRHMENEDNVKPSESIFKRIFEKFGEVRIVDIPICDPYRKDMKAHITGMKTFSFDQELYFEGYVQFSEYLGFVKTMDEFRGMKLVRKEGESNLAVSIKVDFDRTKHLGDANVKRRKILRDRFITRDRAKEEEEHKRLQVEEEKKERERRRQEEAKMAELQRQRQREEKRKQKHLKKIREQEQQELNVKIRSEEKKLMIAQRKLESIRVLEALFDRIKLNTAKKIKIKKEGQTKSKKAQFDLRNKLIKKVKVAQEHELQKLRKNLKKVKNDGEGSADLSRSPSVNLISSDDSVFSDTVQKKKKNKRKRTGNSSSSSSDDDTGGAKSLVPVLPNPMMTAAPSPFPMFNPETGQWMGMGMYPYPQFITAPMVRPEFYSNPFRTNMGGGGAMGYRGNNLRGRYPRSRGRGGYRGRGGNSYHDDQYHGYNKDDDYDRYDDEHDHRKHSRSRSKSRNRRTSRRSRSRSRSRSRRSRSRRSRSRSYSKSRRSRSRSSSRHSKKSRRSRTRSKSKSKLVSTLRRSDTPKRWSSRSKSPSKSRSKRSWSKDIDKRRSRSTSKRRSNRHRSRSHSYDNSPPKIVLQPEKLVQTAKEIQRTVQRKLMERVHEEERQAKTQALKLRPQLIAAKQPVSTETVNDDAHRTPTSDHPSSPAEKIDMFDEKDRSRSKSKSVDSEKFMSPKRKEKSVTPEKEWI